MGYSAQVFKRAEQELARRREAAREQSDARRSEVYAKIPEARKLRREIAETAGNVAKAILLSPFDAEAEIETLRVKNLSLQDRLHRLLLEAGYPQDYLTERRACEKCGGSGFAGTELCDCFRELLKREALTELGTAAPLAKSSFENFRLDLYPVSSADGASPRERMSAICAECKKYAENFSKTSESLLMIGHTGLGKTHLSLAVASNVTQLGYGVLYTSVQKLMDRLEAKKFSYSPEAKEQYVRDIENALSCDLLVLDDLGAEFITQFSASAIYNIVNSRLTESRPTIISTNLDPAEIEQKYAQRMLSRLMGGYRVLKFTGRDIRFEKKMH